MLSCQRQKLPRKGAVKKFEDGREVCSDNAAGKVEYRNRTLAMHARQGGMDPITGEWMNYRDVTFDHEAGRGHGGGHRDDRIEVDGEWQNAALSVESQGIKCSKRYKWVNGKYLPVVRVREVA